MGPPCHRNIKEPLSPLRARAPDPDCARAGAAPAPPAGAAWAAYQRRLLPAPTAHPNVPTLLGTAPAPPAGRRQGRLPAPPPLLPPAAARAAYQRRPRSGGSMG